MPLVEQSSLSPEAQLWKDGESGESEDEEDDEDEFGALGL